MNFVVGIFFFSLLLGQIGALSVAPGVVIYGHDIILLFVVSFSLFRLRGKPVRKSLLTPPLIVFLSVAILSLGVNAWRFTLPQLFQSSLYLLRWLGYAALYVVVIQKLVSERLWLWGLYLSGLGLAMLGAIQFFLYPDLRNLFYLGWDPYYYRLFSTLFDPNFTGILLVLTLLLGFFLWGKTGDRHLILGSVIVGLALLFTFSRSSYMALVAGLLVYGLLRGQWKPLLATVFVLVLVIASPKPPLEAFRLDRSVSSLARVENWRQSIALITHSPLLGHGFNTIRFVWGKPADLDGVPSRAGAGVDSSFLFLGATTGVVGVGVYGWILVSMVRMALALLKTGKEKILGVSALAAISSVLVHSLFTNSLFYPWVMIWLWVLFGVVERAGSAKVVGRFKTGLSGCR